MIYASSVYLAANIANAAIPFALLPLMTRYLPPGEYGKVGVFQSTTTLMSAVIGFNAAASANRRYFADKAPGDHMPEYLGACVQIILASGLSALVVMLCASHQLGAWLGLTTSDLALAVAGSVGAVMAQLILGQLQMGGHVGRYALVQVAQGLLVSLLSIVLVVAAMRGYRGRIEGQVLGVGIVSMATAGFLVAGGHIRVTAFSLESVRHALSFGIPLVPHVAAGAVQATMDRILIASLIGHHQAGIYMVALQACMLFPIVFDALNKSYVPWLFAILKRGSPTEAVTLVRQTYLFFGLTVAAVAAFSLVSPWLVKVVAGQQYADAANLTGVLAIGYGFNGMYYAVANYVFYSNKTGMLSMATVVTGLLNLVLVLWLVPRNGTLGAAIAFACTMGIRFMVTWWLAHLAHPMPWLKINLQTMKRL